MELKIDRKDFESILPVATSKNDQVFEMIRPYFSEAMEEVEANILGPLGASAMDGSTRLQKLVKAVVCHQAFLTNFRSLDLVLTATGFGVVSTQDLTPASKARVDALKSQLDIQGKKAEDRLVLYLSAYVVGWNATEQHRMNVPSLFCRFDHLRYAGIESPTMNDWRRVQPVVFEADLLLRSRISDAQMDALLASYPGKMGNSTVQYTAIQTMLSYIGFHISGDHQAQRQAMLTLLNLMDSHLEDFPEYKESDTYQTNHFKGYENTQDSRVYIFRG